MMIKMPKPKKGYILLELAPRSPPMKFKRYITNHFLKNCEGYCCGITGKFNLMIEIQIDAISDIDKIITSIRQDVELESHIIRTLTYLGTQHLRVYN